MFFIKTCKTGQDRSHPVPCKMHLHLILKLSINKIYLDMKKKSEGSSGVRLMMTPTNYSPEDSLAEDLPSDDEELPRLKLLVEDEISSSRSPSP